MRMRGPLGGNAQTVPASCGYPDLPATAAGTLLTIPVGGSITVVAPIVRRPR